MFAEMSQNIERKVFLTLVMVFLVPFLVNCSSRYRIDSERFPEYEGEINRHTRFIKAPADQIFQALTHERSVQAICPKGTIVTYETSQPYRPGTRIQTRVEHVFKLQWITRVEEVIPPFKIMLRFLDGFFAGGTEIWQLEEKAKVTQVTQTIIVQPKGFLRELAWLLKVRRKHDKMVDAFLDGLKAQVEERASLQEDSLTSTPILRNGSPLFPYAPLYPM